MKNRLYYISDKPNDKPNDKLNIFEHIPPIAASSLVNSSVDHIYLDAINSYKMEDAKKLILLCVTKLRPKGLVTITIYNINHLCKTYLNKSITDENFTEYLAVCQSIFSVDSIVDILSNSSIEISEISYSDNQFIIKIIGQRK